MFWFHFSWQTCLSIVTRSNGKRIATSFRRVPLRLYFEYLRNQQKTWNYFFLFLIFLKFIFESKTFTLSLHSYIFRGQKMCFMYLFSPCVFILVKPSVKKPDKLKLLTPFKSIGFCFSSFLDWYCLFQRFLLIWCIFAFICCLLKIKFFKVTQHIYKNFFVVHQCINCILF